MQVGILAVLAEYELELKAERADAKRALIRQRGGSLGGAKPKFDPEQADAIRRAVPDDEERGLWHAATAALLHGFLD
jgi:DNA invertase Pin-like site-specific DNA recombinase